MDKFKQPLSIYFIWNPANEAFVKPIVDHCTDLLSRDIDKPFSRSMNLPIFFRTSISNNMPKPIEETSQKTILFVFLSKEIIADENWLKYVEGLPSDDNIHIIPIAIDQMAFKVRGTLKDINQIRTYNIEKEHMLDKLFISIAHEIYRWTLNETTEEIKVGSDKALKIFISHAKDNGNGIKLAKGLKNIIDNSSMNNFFDATDIAQGYKFDEEIINHIKDSTMISINSDLYSSRYWCQRELISAKEFNRPIVVVDTLHDFEDRRFPFSANVPGVYIHVDEEPTKKDLLKILTVSLLETVRFFYSKRLLNHYKDIGWIDKESIICSRPPDISDFNNIFDNTGETIGRKCKSIVYPEPPLYSEELMFLSRLGIEMTTPLKSLSQTLLKFTVGISISEPSAKELTKIGHSNYHLAQLSQDIARHIISAGSELIYGGDLREDGFTEFIFNEAGVLQSRLQSDDIFVKNYIAWPIYLESTEEFINWVSKYSHVAKMIKVDPPGDTAELIVDKDTFLPPSSTQNRFVWSRSLTEMRTKMIDNCRVRIFAGGRHSGYKGKMPGVLEEILISLKEGRAVYLLGGFGGVTSSVCKSIIRGELELELSLDWQLMNNAGLKDVYEFSKDNKHDYFDDLNSVRQILKDIDLKNGLSKEENERLFKTQYSDEVIYLVLKGMWNIGK